MALGEVNGNRFGWAENGFNPDFKLLDFKLHVPMPNPFVTTCW